MEGKEEIARDERVVLLPQRFFHRIDKLYNYLILTTPEFVSFQLFQFETVQSLSCDNR